VSDPLLAPPTEAERSTLADEWECPHCGLIPVDAGERERHEAGVDERHLVCPHQDIEAIKAQQRPARSTYNGMPWG
jgi:hypothetical protein